MSSVEYGMSIVPGDHGIDQAVARCVKKARQEREFLPSAWTTYNRDIEAFEYQFRRLFQQRNRLDLIPQLPIKQELVEREHHDGRPVAVLDLMGFGAVFDDMRRDGYPFSHGISVSLAHDGLNDAFDHVTGNILFKETWDELQEAMRKRNIVKFGLILWAPAGGLSEEYITDSTVVYNELLHRVWSLLSIKNGLLLAETPFFLRYEDTRFIHWIERVQQQFQVPLRNRSFASFYLPEDSYQGDMLLEKSPLTKNLPSV